jgi:hypothetical protein
MQNNNLQWHDFPSLEGLYAIKDDNYTSVVNINYGFGADAKVWYFRPHGAVYSYPFNPEDYHGKMFGPIKLPKV